MNVLVVNAGSSSLKYQMFDTTNNVVVAKGLCERIGINGESTIGAISHTNLLNKKDYKAELPMANHTVATQYVVDALLDAEHGCVKSMAEIEAVGHRIVHGGTYFSESVLLNEDVLAKLELCRDLAPLHTPAHIQGIEGCLKVMPDTPQVLVFDTAFHQTMAPKAYMYGVSYDMYEKYGVRRYGFHGTSHRYVSGEMLKILGKTEGTKIVTCHLGNGSSISAVKDGKVMDTTMGFTPLAGVFIRRGCGRRKAPPCLLWRCNLHARCRQGKSAPDRRRDNPNPRKGSRRPGSGRHWSAANKSCSRAGRPLRRR